VVARRAEVEQSNTALSCDEVARDVARRHHEIVTLGSNPDLAQLHFDSASAAWRICDEDDRTAARAMAS
jgi:hypothetical protein